MTTDKRDFKKEIKEFWDDYGTTIKVGARCLTVGLFVGFVKGVLTESKMHSEATCRLIDKIPYEPDPENIADYVHEHIDELRPYIET